MSTNKNNKNKKITEDSNNWDCHFCKKKYETYPILMCDNIECFAMEMIIRDYYYDDKEKVGVCKTCRDKEIYKNPLRMLDLVLPVSLQLEVQRLDAKKNGDIKHIKTYDEALNRVEKLKEKIDKNPEVQALYKKNNPAGFLEEPKEKVLCHYCGENNGQKWINNPNDGEQTTETCWWVCIPCSKIIELQKNYSITMFLKNKAEEHGVDTKDLEKKAEEIKLEIYEVSDEDVQDVSGFEITQDDEGKVNARKVI